MCEDETVTMRAKSQSIEPLIKYRYRFRKPICENCRAFQHPPQSTKLPVGLLLCRGLQCARIVSEQCRLTTTKHNIEQDCFFLEKVITIEYALKKNK